MNAIICVSKLESFTLFLELSGNGYRAALCTLRVAGKKYVVRFKFGANLQVLFFTVIVLDKRLYGFGKLTASASEFPDIRENV